MSHTSQHRTARGWLPLLVLALALGAFHGGLAWTWLQRSPAPISSPHANDHAALVHAMTLAGRADLGALEGGRFGQEDCSVPPPNTTRGSQLRGLLRSDPNTTYRNKTPIAYLLGALAPLLLGFGPLTVRAGSLVLLAVLGLATFVATRAFTARNTAMAAAAAVTLLPVAVGGTQTLFPTLGCMAGAACGLAAILASDRFRRPGLALLAGLAAALAMRWGESFNDGIRTVSVLAGPALLLAVAGLLDRERRWRAALGVGLFVAVQPLLLDWPLARASIADLLAQASGDPSSDSGLLTGLGSYLWILRHRLLGLTGVGLLLTGLPVLLLRGRPRVESLALILAVLGPLLLLAASDKRASYYLAVVAAPCAMIATVGLAALPRVGRWLAWAPVALLMPGACALYLTDAELPDDTADPPAWHGWLALDTRSTAQDLPARLALTHDLPVTFPPVEALRPERGSTASWLDGPEATAILDQLPPGSTVAVQGWVHPHCDVAAFTIQARYPELEVVSVKVPQQPLGCAEAPPLWVSVRWEHEPSARPHWANRWIKLGGNAHVELYGPS